MAEAQYKYSPSTGAYGIVGPDGKVKQIPAEQVPEAVRTRTMAKYNPPPPPKSLEEKYESQVARLPSAAQWVAPGTIGEASGMVSAPLAAAFAPETLGLSEIIPPLIAGGAGYFEPSNEPWLSSERFKRAGVEAGKQALAQVGGKLIAKPIEWTGRFIGKGGMLERSAQRIGKGVANLFHDYPLDTPLTSEALERQIANGELKAKAGANLGKLRDEIGNEIAPYVPGESPKLVPASAGTPMHYTPGRAPSGVKFTLPDLDADGNRIMRDFNAKDAIDHIRRLQGLSYTAAGGQKGAELSSLYREAGHDARALFLQRLKQVNPQLAERYAKGSADYGTSVVLEDAFQNARRTSVIKGEPRGVIDQAKLHQRINKEMPDLTRLQGGKAVEFQNAISPTGAEAIPETPWGGRVGGGLSGLHSFLHLPTPMMPETRALLPQPARLLTSAPAKPLLGNIGMAAGSQYLYGGQQP